MAKSVLPLTNSQVLILKCLSRNPNGLSRDQINEKTGVVSDSDTLGPIYEENLVSHPDSLYAYGLVIPAKETPDTPTVFKLTARGETAAESYAARVRGAKIKVESKLLDKAVMKVRALKTYGLELFTEDDVKEIRALLPEDYQSVTVPDLRQQIVNRRKQGAYATNKIVEPQWYVEYRESKEGRLFADKVLDYYGGCALCLTGDDVKVYHRRFTDDDGNDILGTERIKDGIALCGSCRKRQGRFMCAIPDQSPFFDAEGLDPGDDVEDMDTPLE